MRLSIFFSYPTIKLLPYTESNALISKKFRTLSHFQFCYFEKVEHTKKRVDWNFMGWIKLPHPVFFFILALSTFHPDTYSPAGLNVRRPLLIKLEEWWPEKENYGWKWWLSAMSVFWSVTNSAKSNIGLVIGPITGTWSYARQTTATLTQIPMTRTWLVLVR